MIRLKFVKIMALTLLFAILLEEDAHGQCAGIKVEHTSGVQQVGCTEVTVTSSGSVDVLSPAPCNYGPYWVGRNSTGSYTFTFSSAVQGVTIDVQTLDNFPALGVEEMLIYVNGTFYPITIPGTTDGCWDPAIIWPPGSVRAPVGGHGSWKDLFIPGPINDIKVTNNWVQGSPAGFFINLYICCIDCTTNAGIINTQDIEICSTDPANFSPSEQFVLDPNDILQYILFSEPGNPIQSIIATSDSPSFNFDPALMTEGTTYYIAAIAGNNLNGNVDLNDPCRDLSNTIAVTWMPLPTVTFFSSAQCLNPGDCYNININFTGTPPFQLTAEVVLGNNVITTLGGTFTSTTAVQSLCIPANAPLGGLTIEATSLMDAFCTCN